MGRAVNPLALPTMVRIHPSPPFAHVAQGEERILGKDEVTGSNPVVGFLKGIIYNLTTNIIF